MSFLVLATLLTPALSAQNRRSRQQPRIPKEVLEQKMISEAEVAERIANLKLWLNGKFSADPNNISDTVTFKRKNEDGVTTEKKLEITLTFQNFRKHATPFISLKNEPLIFDVMEVSAIRKDWFENIAAVCDKISGTMRRMDNARMRWSLKAYASEYAKFEEDRKRCLELLSKQKQFEISKKSDILKKLEQDNKRRRVKAYREAQQRELQQKSANPETKKKRVNEER